MIEPGRLPADGPRCKIERNRAPIDYTNLFVRVTRLPVRQRLHRRSRLDMIPIGSVCRSTSAVLFTSVGKRSLDSEHRRTRIDPTAMVLR